MKTPTTPRSRAVQWLKSFAFALAVLVPIRSSLADWNDVPSGSMEPTILTGERIGVIKAEYGLRVPLTHTWLATWGAPKAGDVVTLHHPTEGHRLVKRVVAGPNDTVELRGGRLIVNGVHCRYLDGPKPSGAAYAEFHDRARFTSESLGGIRHPVMSFPGITAQRDFGPFTVPPDHYFVMGDNRDRSADSRSFGPVARRLITGRVYGVVASVDPAKSYRPRWDRWFHGVE